MKTERQQKEPQKAEPIQSKRERSKLSFIDNRPQTASQTKLIQSIQKKENQTGLPDNLKTGMENLSGFSMDDVCVHYNSSKPAQLNALAYAQGTDIHVAPGQEKHLPHEAWHVVQQKQGRVQPTMQMQGVSVNDNEGLEKEADVMGEKTLSFNKINDRLYGDVKNIQKKERVQFKYTIPHTVVQCLMVKEEFINSTKPKVGRRGVHNGAYYTVIEQALDAFHDADAGDFKRKMKSLVLIIEQIDLWKKERPGSSRASAREKLLDQAGDEYLSTIERITPMPLQIPPILLANLTGVMTLLEKAQQLFTNLNQFPFVYTGIYNDSKVGFTAGVGDCQTLSRMFIELLHQQGVSAVLGCRIGDQLILSRAIHGRVANFNTDPAGEHCWFFGEHYWVKVTDGTFDVLFMTRELPQCFSLTLTKEHKKVKYRISNNGYCLIEEKNFPEANIKDAGYVFKNEQDTVSFIDRVKGA